MARRMKRPHVNARARGAVTYKGAPDEAPCYELGAAERSHNVARSGAAPSPKAGCRFPERSPDRPGGWTPFSWRRMKPPLVTAGAANSPSAGRMPASANCSQQRSVLPMYLEAELQGAPRQDAAYKRSPRSAPNGVDRPPGWMPVSCNSSPGEKTRRAFADLIGADRPASAPQERAACAQEGHGVPVWVCPRELRSSSEGVEPGRRLPARRTPPPNSVLQPAEHDSRIGLHQPDEQLTTLPPQPRSGWAASPGPAVCRPARLATCRSRASTNHTTGRGAGVHLLAPLAYTTRAIWTEGVKET